jgi:RNA-binding protein
MKLTSNQRKHLESLANQLKPVIRVGKQGLGAKIVSSINEAFNTQELIKIKILDNAEVSADEVAETAVSECHAQLVRIIGRVLILYKPFSEKKPRIELPAK